MIEVQRLSSNYFNSGTDNNHNKNNKNDNSQIIITITASKQNIIQKITTIISVGDLKTQYLVHFHTIPANRSTPIFFLVFL